ncbi:hypothetical protein PR202_gb09149 [Eleusine coracana subsp. coracana]|uniref:Protein phosphatase n=1 Tax=Eleusine coracana subsp. coracana TaxID=191504 RepID=A0AAV5EGM7_ELECO|nr:hypothetical protein PR202_gb09149 [Eleusine coracana subsp. coracana]
MDAASCYVQHHDEDAHFVHAEAGVIGVTDAVSAFRKDGADRLAPRHDSAVVHRSASQQHRFSCPFQLRSKGGDGVGDGEVGGAPVAEGDVVVVGTDTDGLFDNVFDAELERVVTKGAEMGLSPQGMAIAAGHLH